MKLSTILGALVALTLVLPTAASAASASAIRSQMEQLATVIEQLGKWQSAAQLRGTMDATPDEDLEKVYGGVDLTPLIGGLQDVGRTQAEVADANAAAQSQFDAARLASVARALKAPQGVTGTILSAGLPDAAYPSELEFCPDQSNIAVSPTRRSDTQTQLQLTQNLFSAVQGLEQVEIVRSLAAGIWSGLDRVCDQCVAEFLLGQNFQVACIPVDIVFAVVEFILAEAKWGISIAQSNLGMIRLCDALVDTEELTANYTRVGHIHDDLDDFKTEENAKLDILEAKWDLALRVLLERDLQWNSGDRMNVNYLDRLTDSCDAAEQAITDSETLGYTLHVNAKPSLLKGQSLIATDPKAALDLCRLAYRLATVGSPAFP